MEKQQEADKKTRGGYRGFQRAAIGKVRSVKFPDDLWSSCLAHPAGAGAFIREAVREKLEREKK